MATILLGRGISAWRTNDGATGETREGIGEENECRLDSEERTSRIRGGSAVVIATKKAFATAAFLRSGLASEREQEDRDGERLHLREKVPETAINYRLISHNYRPSQTSGMPGRQRLSMQVCEEAPSVGLAAACEKSSPRTQKSSPSLIIPWRWSNHRED